MVGSLGSLNIYFIYVRVLDRERFALFCNYLFQLTSILECCVS